MEGMPSAASSATNSWTPILSNANVTDCPNGCFRPAGLTWDSKGRLYMTSDTTGEIYIITANDGSGVDGMASPTGSASTPSSTKSAAAVRSFEGMSLGFVFSVAALLALF
jgi:hypothetical protein